MCCPYFYPACCDDGYCYTYQSYCPSSGNTTTTVSFGCPADYPVDCYNGWCCPADYPYCGTGFRTGKCFTGPPGPCAAEAALEKDQAKLDILRTYRDEVLEQNPRRQIIDQSVLRVEPCLSTGNRSGRRVQAGNKGVNREHRTRNSKIIIHVLINVLLPAVALLHLKNRGLFCLGFYLDDLINGNRFLFRPCVHLFKKIFCPFLIIGFFQTIIGLLCPVRIARPAKSVPAL